MPHFVIECPAQLLDQHSPRTIMQAVYDTAAATGLFAKDGPGGIKVRITPFEHYLTVNQQDDFIHIFANIMEGRTIEQRKDLSFRIIKHLKSMFPDVPILSMNIREFEKATYCNKSMV